MLKRAQGVEIIKNPKCCEIKRTAIFAYVEYGKLCWKKNLSSFVANLDSEND